MTRHGGSDMQLSSHKADWVCETCGGKNDVAGWPRRCVDCQPPAIFHGLSSRRSDMRAPVAQTRGPGQRGDAREQLTIPYPGDEQKDAAFASGRAL